MSAATESVTNKGLPPTCRLSGTAMVYQARVD
jgi:hypothetical protein